MSKFMGWRRPWGIAVEGNKLYVAGNKLYVASYQDSVIYEFNATTGARLSDSIKLSIDRRAANLEFVADFYDFDGSQVVSTIASRLR